VLLISHHWKDMQERVILIENSQMKQVENLEKKSSEEKKIFPSIT
jgi:hypothetical protein